MTFQLPGSVDYPKHKWGKKEAVTPWLLDLMDERALAVWAMDDGSLGRSKNREVNGFSFFTNAFSEEAVRTLAAKLKSKWGLGATPRFSKGWYLKLRKECTLKLLKICKPYIHPDLAYKFGQETGYKGGYEWSTAQAPYLEEVLSVENLGEEQPLDLFDIEVEETHRFFVRTRLGNNQTYVSGVSALVHNCHVISAWNDNFRHAYTYIGDAIERYQPRVVLAVTATFNKRIEEDVRRVLGTPKAKKIVSYTPRMNLHLSSSEMRSQQDVLDKVREIDGKILIYCGWKKNCEKYAQYLSRELEEEVGVYHSQVTGTVKKSCQDRFARKNDLRIVCATNAFGMGVDIPDIGAVIHIVYPGDPESLDQEQGRGGRNGQDCICHTFQSRGAHDFQMKLLESGHPTRPLFERVFDVMKRKADKDGVFHMDAMEIQALSNVEIDYQTAIIQTLQGAKVIETVKGVAKTYRIKILKEPDWEGEKLNATQIHYARMTEFIRKEFSLSNGAYDFDIDILAQMLGLAPSTMATHLRSWHAEGLVQYDPPPRTTPKRVIGDLSLVQFDRLRIKRSEAFGKLDYVEAYFDQPDDKKREYLRDYFLATAGD